MILLDIHFEWNGVYFVYSSNDKGEDFYSVIVRRLCNVFVRDCMLRWFINTFNRMCFAQREISCGINCGTVIKLITTVRLKIVSLNIFLIIVYVKINLSKSHHSEN